MREPLSSSFLPAWKTLVFPIFLHSPKLDWLSSASLKRSSSSAIAFVAWSIGRLVVFKIWSVCDLVRNLPEENRQACSSIQLAYANRVRTRKYLSCWGSQTRVPPRFGDINLDVDSRRCSRSDQYWFYGPKNFSKPSNLLCCQTCFLLTLQTNCLAISLSLYLKM